MTAAPLTERRTTPPDWAIVVGFWAVVAGLLVARAVLQTGSVPLLGDGDDAMRIVTATDLLGGQGWQDIIQHRDDAPFGSPMHWSRLIDAPLALIIALATPIFGNAAPDVAAIAWPLLLLLPLLFMSAALTRRLVPDAGTLTAIALPVISMVMLIEFLPGRADHHNVQILLSLSMLLPLLLARQRWLGGLASGFAAATSLAIGIETLPVIAVTVGVCAMLWVADPARYRPAVAAFAITLALGTSLHLFAAAPPAQLFRAACDALSVTYAVAALIGGGALLAVIVTASALSLRGRLVAMTVAGAAALALIVVLFPTCLGGPYADVSPDVMSILFVDIAEAQSLFERLFVDPATGIAFTATALIALPLTAAIAWRARGERRVDWLILLAFLAATTAVMLLQIRGARLATPFALPAAAWLITAARQRYLASRGASQAAVLVGSWLLMSGVAQFGLLGAVAIATAPATASAATTDAGARKVCFLGETYAALAALPAGRVAAPYRIGPHILRYTPHAVVATGFHRNGGGILDITAFFAGDESAAKRIVAERGIDYVVICRGAPEYGGIIGPSNAGHWTWLTPLSAADDRLQVYAVAL